MKTITINQLKDMQISVADTIIENREYLGEIDRKIGDGDHGEGMYVGFSAVKKMLAQNKKYETVSDFYKDMGMALLSSMGGASGVLFASIYISLAEETKDATQLEVNQLIKGYKKAVECIKKRGGASAGDKTMVDALEPAVKAMEKNFSREADFVTILSTATTAAETGVLATKEMVSKHGRSKNLYERTLGFQDAGATSVALIFATMLEYVSEVENNRE
ncbi:MULTISPECIES: dihydroxyacetone kinase subunit DhaL [Enterococcus]|uniref:Dihydroxyacetone kinase subunit L n=1 Tax=Enterococcus alishanensis TaxID=1303817 RepID=A0ABS6TEI3_9ENTE|nr:dihydroxyacetone kinase subunit DhaL [Enterococcus alishanensis]MBV7391310.1 dihydroxyacetone kinase subunit L [Enterococcus alishanensis]